MRDTAWDTKSRDLFKLVRRTGQASSIMLKAENLVLGDQHWVLQKHEAREIRTVIEKLRSAFMLREVNEVMVGDIAASHWK